MRKLVYAAYIDKTKESGVYKKILAQCNEFSKYFEVVLICTENSTICIESNTKSEIKNSGDILDSIDSVNKLSNIINKYRNINTFNLFLLDFVKIHMPQVFYIRKYKLFCSGLNMIKYAKRSLGCYVIYEMPTYPDKMEFIKNKKILRYLHNKYIDARVEKIADKITVVLGKDIILDKKKYLPIMNGINVCKAGSSNTNKMNNILNLIGVAHLDFWHGFDRVIEGINSYYKSGERKNADVNFHIVGDGSELGKLKKMADQYNLNNHVFFHGIKVGQELDDIFSTCDVGVGSLGNHRKGLTKDSSLKNREYCSRGIPFIIASVDDGFGQDFKYAFKVKPDESPICIGDVINFYDSIRTGNYYAEMRDYAAEYLTWEAVMRPVIDLINEGAAYEYQ